jgi:hypothetical protein
MDVCSVLQLIEMWDTPNGRRNEGYRSFETKDWDSSMGESKASNAAVRGLFYSKKYRGLVMYWSNIGRARPGWAAWFIRSYPWNTGSEAE